FITILITSYSNFSSFYGSNKEPLMNKDTQKIQSLFVNLKTDVYKDFEERNNKVTQLKKSLINQIRENDGWGKIAQSIADELQSNNSGTIKKQKGKSKEERANKTSEFKD